VLLQLFMRAAIARETMLLAWTLAMRAKGQIHAAFVLDGAKGVANRLAARLRDTTSHHPHVPQRAAAAARALGARPLLW
jgi:hypothetical protein